ncbi:glycosyltransferase family 4 protein [Roseimaritima ulvae]|uniref:Glycosyl transferases group 1 n=1 Tax=Roseimaritima ulvae TaxID=980254 RepID=A0A5B9QT31_9BACT|nr:glycosyltransferase family 4 protein [Roseimaritima ulvae]QEG40236.1 Glycosyl transferases group 1 [Roseimaritima ulvae]
MIDCLQPGDASPISEQRPAPLDCRVVLLTHYIPLYQVRVFQQIAAAVRDFHVLLSTPLEPNRNFEPDWGGLDCRVQKNLTLRRRWIDRGSGFQDQLYVHLPYDTLAQLRRLNPDVVLSLELGARSMAAALHRKLHRRSRLVLCTYMSQHTERSRGWARRMIRRPLLRSADAVTYNGPSCQSYLRSQGVPEPRLFHLPYAADDRTMYRGPLERDERRVRPLLVSVGQLSERKGLLPLVEQLSRYASRRPQQRIELLLAGEGPLRDAIANVARPANFILEMPGNVPAAKLAERMASRGVAVLPTLADEWLLVVNEAMQAGLPVIGSRYAQAVETLVEQGVNGWRYDPLQPASLDAVLDQYFAADDQQLAAMRDAARKRVASRTPAWAARGAIEAIRYVQQNFQGARE